jgi:phospholipid/cholesterol/gamma-HCH transport system ATP-binding protein
MEAMVREPDVHIAVKDLTLAFGSFVVQQHLDFSIRRGDVFIIMGGSGCGKSTLLKAMIGLQRPATGDVWFDGTPLWAADDDGRTALKRRFGTLFQSGALWSAMTLAENVALVLRQFTALTPAQIDEVARYTLMLVGLAGFEDYYPSEISGGMKKRAGLARAMALNPEILFFDEPSAGLDPLTARRLDELVLELRETLGTTLVVVTHELASLFAIGTNGVFLDADTRTQLATGNPAWLRDHATDPKVRAFLRRGEPEPS